MTHQYTYFPRATASIGSAMLDANVTASLDSIARRGSDFRDEATRERMSDLLDRLGESEVLAMAGLGAAEGNLRRVTTETDYSTFHRRSAHALSLLNENRDLLRRWVAGEDVRPVVIDIERERDKRVEGLFHVVVDNYLLPSYALVAQAYWLYLSDPIPMRALRRVERVAGEIRCRGSREMMLAILLLAGTRNGQDLALNIMKLRAESGLRKTLDAIWNTSFDLTYTRLAVSFPLYGGVPEPVVFITADKHLSTFMNTIEPLGAGMTRGGTALPLDSSNFEGLVRDDLYENVQALMLASAQAVAANSERDERVTRIRRNNSIRHIARLEALFADRADGT
ncbi:hypothetical protein [Microbacterium lacus]|uniref:Uncharacterized protein n=1 Tax=Microbacterium lacus TaxID=415217 RepID=A0ABN2FXY3_9MICO